MLIPLGQSGLEAKILASASKIRPRPQTCLASARLWSRCIVMY